DTYAFGDATQAVPDEDILPSVRIAADEVDRRRSGRCARSRAQAMQGVERSMSLRADRLQLLYDVARSITTFTDLDPLLRFATRRVRELHEAEGCAVLLLDEERRRLFFPVASQATSRHSTGEVLAEISFPAHV